MKKLLTLLLCLSVLVPSLSAYQALTIDNNGNVVNTNAVVAFTNLAAKTITGSGGGVSNLNYFNITNAPTDVLTNNYTGSVYLQSPSVYAPAANEVITRQYLDNVLANNITYYGTTNYDGTNIYGTPSAYMSLTNPAYSYTRTYTGNITNGRYFTALLITNITAYSGPFVISKNISVTTSGGKHSLDMVYEVYFSTNQSVTNITDPNWVSGSFPIIVDGTTNSYTTIVSVPFTISSPNTWIIVFSKVVQADNITSLSLYGGGSRASTVSFNGSYGALSAVYQPASTNLTKLASNDGGSLTNLLATNIVGTIPSALLPAMNYVANTNGSVHGSLTLTSTNANAYSYWTNIQNSVAGEADLVVQGTGGTNSFSFFGSGNAAFNNQFTAGKYAIGGGGTNFSVSTNGNVVAGGILLSNNSIYLSSGIISNGGWTANRITLLTTNGAYNEVLQTSGVDIMSSLITRVGYFFTGGVDAQLGFSTAGGSIILNSGTETIKHGAASGTMLLQTNVTVIGIVTASNGLYTATNVSLTDSGSVVNGVAITNGSIIGSSLTMPVTAPIIMGAAFITNAGGSEIQVRGANGIVSGRFYASPTDSAATTIILSQATGITISSNLTLKFSSTALTTGTVDTTISRNGVGSVLIQTNLTVAGSLIQGYTQISAGYTLTQTNHTVEVTNNAVNITLPTAIGISGRHYEIKNTGNGVVTILTTSSQTIDGNASGTVTLAPLDGIGLKSNGANWIILY